MICHAIGITQSPPAATRFTNPPFSVPPSLEELEQRPARGREDHHRAPRLAFEHLIIHCKDC